MIIFGIAIILVFVFGVCINCDKYEYRDKHIELAKQWETEYRTKPQSEVPKKVWHYQKMYHFMDTLSDWDEIFVPLLVVDSITLILMGFVLIANYVSAPYEIKSKQAEYDVIMYQVENDMYRYNNAGTDVKTDSKGNVTEETVVVGYGQYQLMQEIKDWNKWIIGRNAMEKNWAVGIFYPKFSDKLFPIDLSKLDYDYDS